MSILEFALTLIVVFTVDVGAIEDKSLYPVTYVLEPFRYIGI
jgi:hypothetical protein